jgi:hypothetical protein
MTKLYAPIWTLLEKAVSTYVQVLIGLMLLGGTMDVKFSTELAVAALPAAFTVIANGVAGFSLTTTNWFLDTFFRVVKTFVATFLGLLVAPLVFNLSVNSARLAAVGAIAATLAVIKAAIAAHVGSANTAALLPVELDAAAA